MVSDAVQRLAERHKASDEVRRNMLAAIGNLEGLYEGLGLCLSHEPDLLSQWRGYADDGTGLAIGFNRSYLEWLAEDRASTGPDLELAEVKYKSDEHEVLVEPVFLRLRELLESDDQFVEDIPPSVPAGSPEYKRLEALHGRLAVLTLLQAAMPSLGHVYLLKHRAFAEEREVRLLHRFGWLPTQPCEYHARRGSIVQYRSRELPPGPIESISKIVLGPKHTTPVSVVENFLSQFGFHGVEVIPSQAPYR